MDRRDFHGLAVFDLPRDGAPTAAVARLVLGGLVPGWLVLCAACPPSPSAPAESPAPIATVGAPDRAEAGRGEIAGAGDARREAGDAQRAANARSQLEARVHELRAGNLPEDATDVERAAMSRMQQVEALRRSLREVIDRLPAEQSAARDVQQRVEAAMRALGADEFDAALARVKQASASRRTSSDHARVLEEARRLDAQIETMAKTPWMAPGAVSTPAEQHLVKEVQQAQESLEPLVTAARMTFRTLAVLAQLRVALPELEAQAARVGAPSPHASP